MVVGASGQPGQSALLTVAVEHDVKLAHVPTLPQPMEERTALGWRRINRPAINRNAVSSLLYWTDIMRVVWMGSEGGMGWKWGGCGWWDRVSHQMKHSFLVNPRSSSFTTFCWLVIKSQFHDKFKSSIFAWRVIIMKNHAARLLRKSHFTRKKTTISCSTPKKYGRPRLTNKRYTPSNVICSFFVLWLNFWWQWSS